MIDEVINNFYLEHKSEVISDGFSIEQIKDKIIGEMFKEYELSATDADPNKEKWFILKEEDEKEIMAILQKFSQKG